MQWVIGSVVGALTIIIQFYIWVWPRLQKNTLEKQAANQKLKQGLEVATKKAENYGDYGLDKLREIIADPQITERLRSQVKELESLASECIDWRNESWLVIRAEVMRLAIENKYTWLNDSLILFFNSNIDGVLSGYYGHFSEPIFESIYKGNLSFELVRDSLAERRWDQSKQIGDKVITIKEVVESNHVHKLVEELQQLQKRLCFQRLRELRQLFIEKALSLLKEVSPYAHS
jgi:hypothetical protein